MAMSRRDYQAVAETIQSELEEARKMNYDGEYVSAIENVAEALTVKFQQTHSGFDRRKFLKAAGLL